MKILSLTIQNFRSFVKPQTLEFSGDQGLFLVTGENQVTPTLGANAAGKSTIWEALTWCLFGKTSRGLKGPSVVSWAEEAGVEVQVVFESDSHEYTLIRGWGPNKLQICSDGETETVIQDDVDRITGFEYSTFLHTVMFGQFGSFFFDLSATEKLTMFSSALNLDRWIDASNDAKIELKKVDATLRTCEQKHSSLDSNVKLTLDVLEQTMKDAEEFEGRREKLLAELQEGKSSAERAVESKRIECERAEKEKDELSSVYTEAQRQFTLIDAELRAISQEAATIQGGISARESSISKIRSRRPYVPPVVKDVCSACGQKLPPGAPPPPPPPDTSKQEIEEIEQEISDLRKTSASLAEKKSSIEGKYKEIRAKHTVLEDARLNLHRTVSNLHGEVSKHEREVANHSSQIKRALEERNSYAERALQQKKDLARWEAELVEAKKELDKLKVRVDVYDFWAKTFKQVRLWLIEEALDQLTVEVNNTLLQLGLVGWSIAFDVERENTSGGVTRGFQVLITSPGSLEGVPWEAWSGGETQRLRIAGAIGLQNLIRSYSRASCNIEVWDEPTSHLNEDGVQDLLKFLDERAAQEGKLIWLVDHRSLSYGGFDDQINVVKTKEGSRIDRGCSFSKSNRTTEIDVPSRKHSKK